MKIVKVSSFADGSFAVAADGADESFPIAAGDVQGLHDKIQELSEVQLGEGDGGGSDDSDLPSEESLNEAAAETDSQPSTEEAQTDDAGQPAETTQA